MALDLEQAWHPWNPDSRGLRLAHALAQGMSELNALFPHRPQGGQEGSIGDAAHRSEGTGSDHNPNAAGVVRAWDIDCTPGAPFDPQKLANALAAMMRTPGKYNFFGSKGYVIYNRRITSWSPWGSWVPYSGKDPHTGHIHLSVGANPGEYDDVEPWNLAAQLGVRLPAPAPVPKPAPAPVPAPVKDPLMDAALTSALASLRTVLANDINGHLIAYSGPRYLRFPKFANPNVPNAGQAIYAWNGASLTWLTAQEWAAIGTSLHVLDIPDHLHSNIFRSPITAGTPDPRK